MGAHGTAGRQSFASKSTRILATPQAYNSGCFSVVLRRSRRANSHPCRRPLSPLHRDEGRAAEHSETRGVWRKLIGRGPSDFGDSNSAREVSESLTLQFNGPEECDSPRWLSSTW